MLSRPRRMLFVKHLHVLAQHAFAFRGYVHICSISVVSLWSRMSGDRPIEPSIMTAVVSFFSFFSFSLSQPLMISILRNTHGIFRPIYGTCTEYLSILRVCILPSIITPTLVSSSRIDMWHYGSSEAWSWGDACSETSYDHAAEKGQSGGSKYFCDLLLSQDRYSYVWSQSSAALSHSLVRASLLAVMHWV